MVRRIPLVTFALALAVPALAQTPASSDYAITNARIVVSPGNVIDRGTVVIRAGRIAAVGANVAAPAGVTAIDGAGQTVFAGIIDAATSTALPSPNRFGGDTSGGRGGGNVGGGGGRGRGGAGAPVVRGALAVGDEELPHRSYPINPLIDDSLEAATAFAPSADQLKSLRAGGVTTVGLVFQGGTFPGRVGAAYTGGPDESHLAERPRVAQEVAFGALRGEYPGTGIGAYAYVRQAILDAQYESRLIKANGAAGAPSPSNDPFLRALVPAATNQIPVWFIASTEREINRTADAALELGLRKPAMVGVQEGWRVIPALERSGATAVVSLTWPAASRVTGATFTDMSLAAGGGRGGRGGGAAPAASAPANAAVDAQVRANAAALVKAGIPVVLTSFGGESGNTFRDRIRTTIESGMSPDDALRAVTVTPAALLGISSDVGTVEAGKLANLVMVTGNDLFAAGSPITHVFVQGRLYQ